MRNNNLKIESEKFLSSSKARAFYVDADKRLFAEYVKTQNLKYLENIGSMQAIREVLRRGL